jgi:hypothetical protein
MDRLPVNHIETIYVSPWSIRILFDCDVVVCIEGQLAVTNQLVFKDEKTGREVEKEVRNDWIRILRGGLRKK